jgi:C4-dicarboxylate transporter
MSLAVSSATGLGVLLMATLFPVMVNVGIQTIAAIEIGKVVLKAKSISGISAALAASTTSPEVGDRINLLMIAAYFLACLMSLAVSSATGLGVLLMATLFPVMVNVSLAPIWVI